MWRFLFGQDDPWKQSMTTMPPTAYCTVQYTSLADMSTPMPMPMLMVDQAGGRHGGAGRNIWRVVAWLVTQSIHGWLRLFPIDIDEPPDGAS
jgi:hypothetical protein